MDANSFDADRLWSEHRRTGSARALGELYDALAPELLRLAMHMTRDAAAAEDALQSTFVAAIQRAPSFVAGAHVLPWLIGILGNEVRRQRAQARRELDPARLERSPEPAAEHELERRELLEQLDAALARLPEEFRPVLSLRVRHGLTASEIAVALGRPGGTVRSQMQRGLEELRRVLPASLAGALVALGLTPTRGLAAVRAAVLEQGAAAQLAATSTGVVAGVLLMKKAALAVAAALAATFVWIAWPEAAPEANAPQVAAAPAIEPSQAPRGEPANAAQTQRSDASVQLTQAPPSGAPASDETRSASPESAQLELRVVSAGDDAPVEGEVVSLRLPGALNSDAELEALTDAAGRATFEGLPSGYAFVRALRGDGVQVKLSAGRRSEAVLRLAPGVLVRGVVVDGAGAGVPDAAVWLSARYRTNLGHVVARTDRSGQFELNWVSPDQYLCAFAPGRAPSVLASIQAAAGETLALRLEVGGAAVSARCRVVDFAGRGVAGARILIGDEWPELDVRQGDGTFAYAAPPLRAVSDQEGWFELAHLAPGLQRVQARASGYALFDEVRDLSAGGAPAELRLAPQARLVGSVRDPEGRVLSGVAIRRGEYNEFGGEYVFSGRDGSFEIAGLPAGALHFVAEHAERGREVFDVVAAPGDVLEREVVLGVRPSLRGVLVGPGGAPLPGWGVRVQPTDASVGASVNTQTNRRGEFAFAEVLDVPHTLQVVEPGGWSDFPALVVDGLQPSTRALEIAVPATAPDTALVSAQIVLSNGEPAAGAVLRLSHVASRSWCERRVGAQDASVLVRNVPAGEVELDIRHPERPWLTLGGRKILAGERVDLGLITLSDPAHLRATLRGVEDGRLAGVQALITDASGRESGVVYLKGRELSTGPLASGVQVLTLRGDGIASWRREFALEEGRETRVDIELAPAGVRLVRFQTPLGAEPLAWLSCNLTDSKGALVWSAPWQTRDTLEARVCAPPGQYRLHARTSTGLSASLDLKIEAVDYGGAPLLIALQAQ